MRDIYLISIMAILGVFALISAIIIAYPGLAYLASRFIG